MNTFKLRFLSFLKVALRVGEIALPVVANAVVPGIAPLITTVLNSILTAEGQFGAGNGSAKLQASLTMTQVAAPALIHIIESTTGKSLADESGFAEGVQDLTSSLVKILNAFEVLPKSSVGLAKAASA